MIHWRRYCQALTLVLGLGCGGAGPDVAADPPTDSSAATRRLLEAANATDSTGAVEAEMQNVDFHIEPGIVLQIARLDGSLTRAMKDRPVTFDDGRSFIMNIRSARIAMGLASLDTLLNRHVFGFHGSQLKNLEVSIDSGMLVQRGKLHKVIWVPFTIRSAVSITKDGLIRLHPVSVKALGINVRGLLKFLGTQLDDMIKVERGRGARIEGDDFLLDAAAMLPAPRVRGHLTDVKVEPGGLALVFGSGAGKPGSADQNYMWFRKGVLRFGKLTMADADLKIVDEDPRDRFDFSLIQYNEQLVAGTVHNTRNFGLVVHMPDFSSLPRAPRSPVKLDSKR
ncbi:MAG: hypothetical protein ABI647_07870 [Gemmatimonadota bacterium]